MAQALDDGDDAELVLLGLEMSRPTESREWREWRDDDQAGVSAKRVLAEASPSRSSSQLSAARCPGLYFVVKGPPAHAFDLGESTFDSCGDSFCKRAFEPGRFPLA